MSFAVVALLSTGGEPELAATIRHGYFWYSGQQHAKSIGCQTVLDTVGSESGNMRGRDMLCAVDRAEHTACPCGSECILLGSRLVAR